VQPMANYPPGGWQNPQPAKSRQQIQVYNPGMPKVHQRLPNLKQPPAYPNHQQHKPKGGRKRTISLIGGEGGSRSKKGKILDSVKPKIEGEGRLVLRESGGEISVSTKTLNLRSLPIFMAKGDTKCLAVAIPGQKPPKHFEPFGSWKITCTFLGNNCTMCNYLGGNHPVNKCNVFLVGDNLIPISVGGGGKCIPTLRVEHGSFNQLKEVLAAQLEHKFHPAKGTFVLVGLLAHLFRVGLEEYIVQLEDFTIWAEKNLGWVVVPILLPFPTGLPDNHYVVIQQYITFLQGKYLGDFSGNVNASFSAWKPLTALFEKYNVAEKDAPIPPFLLKGSTDRYIESVNRVRLGFEGDFSNKIPSELEKDFFLLLSKQLETLSSPSSPLTFPTDDALNLGVSGRDSSVVVGLEVPTIFLVGTSILKEIAAPLHEMTRGLGVDVVSSCIGGNIFNNLNKHTLPVSTNSKDCLILHFLGNNIFKHKGFFHSNNKWHMSKPNYLNDNEVDSLISKTVGLLAKISQNFKGKIKLVGPFPRFTDPCCANPLHSLPASGIFQDTLQYTLALNQFLAKHLRLRLENVEFIPFTSIFGSKLARNFTTDGVHLNTNQSRVAAAFMSSILVRKEVGGCPPFSQGAPSFLTWSEISLSKQISVTPTAPVPAVESKPSNTEDTVMSEDDCFELSQAMTALEMALNSNCDEEISSGLSNLSNVLSNQ
jgi:hypothetical protein